MNLQFTISTKALVRTRRLSLIEGSGRYKIPSDPIYQPLRQFLLAYQKNGYPFSMQKVIHVTAVKMLGTWLSRDRSLFAAGGLYMALDQSHKNLAFSRSFDDFTSGFSHQFGVAFATMSMSEAFGVPWHKMIPIPVEGRKTLDYKICLPNGSGWLQLEAKGVISAKRKDGSSNRKNAIRNAYSKKLDDPKDFSSGKRSFSAPTAMVGVVTQAARLSGENGVMEIVDPDFPASEERRTEDNQIAARFLHCAGVARFAGLYNVSDELLERAEALVNRQDRRSRRGLEFDQKALFQVDDQVFAGVQWRVGDGIDRESDIWFYHGVNIKPIVELIHHNEFIPTHPFYPGDDYDSDAEPDRIESILPDGSYFGIGIGRHDGLMVINRQETDLDELQIAKLQ